MKKMSRKLKHVESLCLNKPRKRTTSSSEKDFQVNCVDTSSGVMRQNGETWEKDKCTECNCQVGVFYTLKIILLILVKSRLKIFFLYNFKRGDLFVAQH